MRKGIAGLSALAQDVLRQRPASGAVFAFRGRTWPLAYILTSKFDDHVPLYRLHELFERVSADIPDTTLVDWCGAAMKTLKPLIERIEADVMDSDIQHADDTPIRVLDRSAKSKGLGKGVKQGRIWTYVRDQRPWDSTGILQADAYSGFKPKVVAFHAWAEAQLAHIPGKSDLTKAFRYGLSRWPSFCLFLVDGRVVIDNNAAKRGIRPIGVGRRNWLFVESDTGGETLARAMTISEDAKMNGLDKLLPWNWAPPATENCKAA